MRVGLSIAVWLTAGAAFAGPPDEPGSVSERDAPRAAGVELPATAAEQADVEPSPVDSAAAEPGDVASESPAATQGDPGRVPAAQGGAATDLDSRVDEAGAGTKPPAPSGVPTAASRGEPRLRLARTRELRRSGLFGWGLGLEAPMIGVMTAVAQRSDPGWGYWLGGAISWEASPRLLVRLVGAIGQTYGGKAGVRYIGNVQTNEEERSGQAAELVAVELGFGAAYLFRHPERAWTPFVGVDFGYAFYGYDYQFDDSLTEIEAVDVGDAFRQCTDATCRSDQHDGLMFGPTVTLRGGARLELTRWLASQTELALTYLSLREERISNTVLSRQVSTAPEALLMVRILFTLRVGL